MSPGLLRLGDPREKFHIRTTRYHDRRYSISRITVWEVFRGNFFEVAFLSWEQARICVWWELGELEKGNR